MGLVSFRLKVLSNEPIYSEKERADLWVFIVLALT